MYVPDGGNTTDLKVNHLARKYVKGSVSNGDSAFSLFLLLRSQV